MLSPSHTPALQLAVRAATAAGIAVAAAQGLGLPFPLYAMIAAVLVTDVSSTTTRRLAMVRLLGTLLGALTGVVLLQGMPSGAWAIALGILATMLLSHALRLDDAAKLAGYVCGIVLLDHAGDAWTYAFHRVVETLVGIAAAVIVGFVPKLLSTDEPR